MKPDDSYEHIETKQWRLWPWLVAFLYSKRYTIGIGACYLVVLGVLFWNAVHAAR
jgi:hypothetical protein